MLIFGAKGLAKEILEVCLEKENRDDLVFYDDVSIDLPPKLYNEFSIIRSFNEAESYFKHVDDRFAIGIGGPTLRKMNCEKLEMLGGIPHTIISKKSHIGSFGITIGVGTNIMIHSVITNDIKIGKGVLVNQMSSIGHDVVIGDFVEICPGVSISGNCRIGDLSFLGTNCTILPNVIIGDRVIVGAGSVINKDIPDDCTVVGVPGKIIKSNKI